MFTWSLLYSFRIRGQRRGGFDAYDDNVQSAENPIIDLIYRVRNITGEITDWSDIRASARTGGFTVLNGTVIGKEGIACVESITAGGYNIQRLHIRVLVHSV